jgi:Zn-dependent protease
VEFLKNIDLGLVAIQFAVLLFSLSIHEASHAWMADQCGDHTARYLGRVTLNPIPHIDPIGTILFPLLQFFTPLPVLGWAKPVPVNHLHLKNPKRDSILISAAGPVSNLIVGIIAVSLLMIVKFSSREARLLIAWTAYYQKIAPVHSVLAPIIGILFFVVIINFALAIFNIIPIPPLDGHWILLGFLPESAAAAFERIGAYGFIILYALMFMKVLSYIFMPIGFIVDRLLITI